MRQATKAAAECTVTVQFVIALTTTLNFPQPRLIGNYRDNIIYPYVFVADEGFAMKRNMLHPYSRNNVFDEAKYVFSYRLSRARRVIENTFGMLASRFMIFRRAIIVHIETVVNITKRCVGLHDFLIKETSDHYLASSMSDVEALDDNCLQSFPCPGLNNYPQKAKNIRDKFKDYFVSP